MPTIQLDFERHLTLTDKQHKILLDRYNAWRMRMGIADSELDCDFRDWLKVNLDVARAVVLGQIEE